MSDFKDFSKQIASWISIGAPDAGTKVLELLKREYPISAGESDVWLYGGFSLSAKNRWREALLVHWEHYLGVLSGEVKSGQRQHKGSVLVMISDCFNGIGFPVHAKRYLIWPYAKTRLCIKVMSLILWVLTFVCCLVASPT
jgi:hypothetical protein